MPYPVLPPNPSLVAIVLMIKTREGGHRHVFHYPSNPGQEKPHVKLDYENSEEGEESSESSESDGYSSLEDEQPDDGHGGGPVGSAGDADLDESGSASPEKINGNGWTRPDVSRDGFLGLPVDVQHFLVPPVTAHKKRFEMSIDGRVFLGWPVFSREGGVWRKKKKKMKMTTKKTEPGKAEVHGDEVTEKSTSIEEESDRSQRRSSVQLDHAFDETIGDPTGGQDQRTVEWDSADPVGKTLEEPAGDYVRSREKAFVETEENLIMFHVVFVMNPPPLEYHVRVDEMYDNVVKKFTRALKWEQSRSNFVLKEAEKIRDLEGKHESTQQIIRHSPLAKAIGTLYTSISTSRIAHISLSPSMTFSLQIPIPTSISILPGPTDINHLPGLWLTTATSIPSTSPASATHPTNLASHFALLLLSDLPTILADISATASPLTGPLTHYLRASTPTKSFLQVSQSSGIPLADIQFLAAHLIYWRRARAVPPLHHRDTYIVSPNADMRKLKPATAQYAKLFPALPSLPKMLSLLSATGPRAYSTLIPSKDHKEAYLQILAWLLRGGWVTQLRTFAWVRVPERLQAAVARDLERERKVESEEDGADVAEVVSSPSAKRPATTTTTTAAIVTTVPHSPPSLADHSSSASPSSSLSSTLTAIPLLPPANLRPILITHPTRATGIESRFLAQISAAIEEGDGKEAKEAWEACLKYFNGEHALEKIAAREGWKRKRVEALRGAWKESGWLAEVRGW